MTRKKQCWRNAFRALFLSVFVGSAIAQKQCPLESSTDFCHCKTSDGQSLDITHFANTFTKPFQGTDGFMYAYSPCSDQLDLGNLCQMGSDSAGCQGGDKTPYIVIGKISSVSFVFNTTINSFVATYTGGTDNRQMRAYFLCDNGGTSIAEIGENPELTYNFEIRSKHLCSGSSGSGSISPGSILLIVFFIALILYFVIGVIYMSTVRNATGTDRVPNKNFWVALPGYIKDGALFIISPCRASGGSGGKYESL